MDLINKNSILQSEEYPLYTKRLKDICNFYIKDGKLIKNRGDKFTTKLGEIMNFNNIVIEENGYIEIFCSKEKEWNYDKIINWFRENHQWHIVDKIKVISR